MRLLFSAAVVAFAVPAGAQITATAPSSAVPQTTTPADIVVSADRDAATSTIDRKAYAVQRDLGAAAGSIADVLRNVPSVDVDAAGNVSLRGDTNVQVLIDGKPSAQMSPSTRADALQSLPASGIESIEVITNPSARYKADGSGGIINIITKKNRKPGKSGTATANIGSDARFGLGATSAYHRDKLDLNGALTVKRTVPDYLLTDQRTDIDAVTGAGTGSSQERRYRGHRTAKIATIGVGYAVSPADQLSGNFTYNDRAGTLRRDEHDRLFDPGGALASDFDRDSIGTEHDVATDASATYKHSFAGKGHSLSIDLRYSGEAENQSSRFTNIYRLPLLPTTSDQRRPRSNQREREVTVEYDRPMAAGAKLVLGYDFEREDDAFDTHGDLVDAATGAVMPDPTQTSRFVYARDIHSFYGTYERVFAEKLTALVGVRVEATSAVGTQVTNAEVDRTSYVTAYPTIHLDYALSDTKTLRLSYSHRIVRPDPGELDPYPLFNNPLDQHVGNPALKPQETDAVEGTFAFAPHGVSIELTPYYRRTTNLFSQVVRFITPTQLQTTQANLGTSTKAGVDFSANGKLGKLLSYGVSGTLFHDTIDAANLGIAGTRQITSITAKANLDYQATPKDMIQLNVTFKGKRLLPQGYRLPNTRVDLGFRHQLKPGLSVVATLSDVFDSAKDPQVYDTPLLHEAITGRYSVRAATIALSWAFGGGPKKAAKIDYQD
ncbi:TonB-dependent receptor [Polymorphobacter sp. PAMC 29334]|uniref:TonB-dependent receptor n=1 Tax=Polymorphobacter sp. PAMC 29334 TaxID=2862331 RepID=UPI001C747925|nr:outer membrane beta-barrel family protein [Polymorphobacter sp. PAMC 29334]QYE35185.1 TonB-dependent receptor [Polymorphobacter sp. PAMC 29334]